MNFLLHSIAIVVLLIFVGIPWINGVLDVVMAYRFERNVRGKADKTAFLLHWNAFKWGWLHTADEIVEKIPAFKQDLSEIWGLRPDDGRIT